MKHLVDNALASLRMLLVSVDDGIAYHQLAFVLVCAAVSVAVDAYGFGHGNSYGGREFGGSRFGDISGGSGGQGFNTGASGGGLNEGHRRDRFTSYTNSEHDSSHRARGHGGYGTNAAGGGRHGHIRGAGSGFGKGNFGGSRIGSGFYG